MKEKRKITFFDVMYIIIFIVVIGVILEVTIGTHNADIVCGEDKEFVQIKNGFGFIGNADVVCCKVSDFNNGVFINGGYKHDCETKKMKETIGD